MASVKPKLLYILHNYFNRAGTEDHVKSLALGLASEFDIFILFPQQSEICLLHPDGRQERFQGALPVWPQTSYRIPAMNQTLAKVLELIRPDLIHIQHFLNWPLSILDQIAETRIPFALTLHDYYTITPYYTFEDVQDPEDCFRADYSLRVFKVDFSPYLTERRKLLSKSLSYAKAVIAPSQFLASAIQKIFPITIRVIEHGAYEFEPRMKTESQGDLRFGYLGGLIPQKGWDLLLTAFLEVNKTFHRTELHFYGAQNRSGQEFKNVFFHGIYEKESLPEICANIDIGVIPSVVPETFCLVLSEFWMSGTVVAASSIGALKDRIQDGKTGRLFPPKNIPEMSKVLRWFLSTEEWKDWELPEPKVLATMINDYRQLYEEMLRG